jgi:hypothetical protein
MINGSIYGVFACIGGFKMVFTDSWKCLCYVWVLTYEAKFSVPLRRG